LPTVKTTKVSTEASTSNLLKEQQKKQPVSTFKIPKLATASNLDADKKSQPTALQNQQNSSNNLRKDKKDTNANVDQSQKSNTLNQKTTTNTKSTISIIPNNNDAQKSSEVKAPTSSSSSIMTKKSKSTVTPAETPKTDTKKAKSSSMNIFLNYFNIQVCELLHAMKGSTSESQLIKFRIYSNSFQDTISQLNCSIEFILSMHFQSL
jgi:hypothetical protein